MLLLGLDVETGGAFDIAPENNFLTEIGLVLWDTDFDQPVELFSALVNAGQPLSPESIETTGITQSLVETHGQPIDVRLLGPVAKLMARADFIVAHNGRAFDHPVLAATFERAGMAMPQKEWIDTMTDIDFPRHCASRNLTYLAGFHGLLNSFPHRAVTDVLTMLTVLKRYELSAVIDNARSPVVVVKANVSFDDREKAKRKRFSWQMAAGRQYDKCWVRAIRENQLADLQADCAFPITILERMPAKAS